MKKLLIIPLLFVCFVSLSQTVNPASIIGKSVRIDNLEVAQFDFPDLMNWDDAKKACEALGSGWRLPTKDELNTLYQNKDKIGGFANGGYRSYWSSTVYVDDFASVASEIFAACYQSFVNGDQSTYLMDDPAYVRAVKVFNLNPTQSKKELDKKIEEESDFSVLDIEESDIQTGEIKWSKGIPFATTINTASDNRYYSDLELKELNKPVNIIGKPIQIGNLLVAQNEFPIKSDWNSAKSACIGLGNGWRLPTKDELYILYQNKNIIRNFSKYGYWSSTEGIMNGNNGVAYYQDFTLGSTKPILENKLSTWGVRAVKSL